MPLSSRMIFSFSYLTLVNKTLYYPYGAERSRHGTQIGGNLGWLNGYGWAVLVL